MTADLTAGNPNCYELTRTGTDKQGRHLNYCGPVRTRANAEKPDTFFRRFFRRPAPDGAARELGAVGPRLTSSECTSPADSRSDSRGTVPALLLVRLDAIRPEEAPTFEAWRQERRQERPKDSDAQAAVDYVFDVLQAPALILLGGEPDDLQADDTTPQYRERIRQRIRDRIHRSPGLRRGAVVDVFLEAERPTVRLQLDAMVREGKLREESVRTGGNPARCYWLTEEMA